MAVPQGPRQAARSPWSAEPAAGTGAEPEVSCHQHRPRSAR